MAKELLEILSGKYKKDVKAYYNLSEEDDLTTENIAKSRNWIAKGALPDIERASTFILRDFRDGKTGKFILD